MVLSVNFGDPSVRITGEHQPADLEVAKKVGEVALVLFAISAFCAIAGIICAPFTATFSVALTMMGLVGLIGSLILRAIEQDMHYNHTTVDLFGTQFTMKY